MKIGLYNITLSVAGVRQNQLEVIPNVALPDHAHFISSG